MDWKRPDYGPVFAERTQRLSRLRADPTLVPAVKAHYRDHPAAFIADWGMTYDPRNVEIGLPATVPFVLFPRQAAFIDWLLERWRSRQDGLAEKSRDMGVSWLCVAFAVWMWLFHAETTIGFGSRKEEYVDRIGDPKSLFWKIRSFIELLPQEFQPAGWNPQKYAPFMRVQNPENAAVIVGEAGDNIGRGNRTSIYFKDESAFYEHAETIDAALSQTSNCKIDVSTPNGAGNPFARKRQGGRLPVFTFHWRDDPRKDQAWYDKQVADLDAVVLAQEVDISYAGSVANAWIPDDIVIEAMAKGPADVEPIGPLQIGVDVARFGDDKTVLTLRRNRVVFPQIVLSGVDTMGLVGRIAELCGEHKEPAIEQIAVDVIGLGAGVVDRLNELKGSDARLSGVQVVAVNSSIRLDDGKNYNLRAKLWRDMRDWLKDAPVSLPNDPELRVDLTALRYGYRNAMLLMEAKDDAKKRGIKSPDRADSLALTFAEPVRAEVTFTRRERNWKVA